MFSSSPTRCTCPSGDGSLNWPCPTHPPEATYSAREPTEAMKDAGMEASPMFRDVGTNKRVSISTDDAAVIWRAMWDAQDKETKHRDEVINTMMLNVTDQLTERLWNALSPEVCSKLTRRQLKYALKVALTWVDPNSMPPVSVPVCEVCGVDPSQKEFDDSCCGSKIPTIAFKD